MNNIHIDFAADVPAFLPTLAIWHHQQWSHLNPTTFSVNARLTMYQQECQRRVPLMVIAHANGKPAGSARLIENDLAHATPHSPWLASLYVAPPLRKQGIGGLLVQRICQEARRLGYSRVYLFTENKQAFFSRAGWREIEQIDTAGIPVTVMEYAILGLCHK